jgi:hypothetical protein
MTWVICQSPTSKETFAVNTDNVRRVVAKGNVSVLEFVDGTAVFISKTLDEWLAEVMPPMRYIQGAQE